MADRSTVLFDGVKSYDLNSLPESAWTYISGHPLGEGDSNPASVYSLVPWVYRAVEMRSTALGDMPWAVLQGKSEVLVSDDWKSVRGLEWTRGMRSLLLRAEAARCVYGASYFQRVGNVLGTKALEYRWLLPTSVKPVYDEARGLVGWKRRLGNRDLDLDLEDVVYSWLPSLTAELGPGTAPVQVALKAAGVIANVDKFVEAFFARGALKVTILSVPPGTPDAEKRRLENWWKKLVRGVKGAFETIALNALITPTVISSDPKDLAMAEVVAQRQKDIAVALGVPFSLLFSEASNLATASQDDLNFYSKCILPECAQIEEDLNRQVFEQLGLRFQFQQNKLELFEERESQKAFALVAMVSAGVMTPNELREKMDLEPKEGGDELKTPTAPPKFGSNAESQGQVQQDNAPNGNTGKSMPRYTDETLSTAERQRAFEREQWQRKSLKALKAGKSPDVSFETTWLRFQDVVPIKRALAIASTAEDVRAAFRGDVIPEPEPLPIPDLVLPDPDDEEGWARLEAESDARLDEVDEPEAE